jgi:hypothetical protein
MEEQVTCVYCNEPLEEGQQTTYMFFPDNNTFKKVHMYHLKAKRGEKNNAKSES